MEKNWNSISSPHFSQTLYYEQPVTGATPCYNGNISAVEWTSRDAMAAVMPTTNRYTFGYDGMNRLTSANYTTVDAVDINGKMMIYNDRYYNTTYQYDLNSNITSLTRQGVAQKFPVFQYSAWNYGMIDNLTMSYDGNQLKKVTDQCNELTYAGAMDFKDGADKATEYTWDANGNMTQDLNKKIWRIKYNVLNLPEEIDYEDGHIVRYTYAADGRKLRVQYLVSNVAVIELNGLNAGLGSTMELMGGNIPPFHPIDTTSFPGHHVETTLLTMDYCGAHIYRNGVLERTMNDYGYQADSTYYYYIKDYQGNVRAVIDQNGALKEINNYYPYGGLMGGAVTGIQPDKYGGKELDRENGIDWYDIQARYQDPMLPMFTTQDPLAEQTPGISPYAYCAGNPIRYIDPTGNFCFENISENTLYMLLTVFPEDRDDIIESDYSAAKNNGIPLVRVENIDDFANALNCLENVLESSSESFAINSHGKPGQFRIGHEIINESTDVSGLMQWLSGKEVFIGACRSGYGKEGKSLTEHLAQSLNAIIITSEHRIPVGYEYDGKRGLEGPNFNEFKSMIGLNVDNSYMVSRKGQSAERIYNLKMHSSFGITWDSGVFSHSIRPYTFFNNLNIIR